MYYEKHIMQNKLIPIIINKTFARQHEESELRFMGNWHESVEFIYILNGSAEVYYEREKIDVEEGDFIIVNSNCSHFINTTTSACFYYLIVDKNFFEENGISMNISFKPVIKDKSYGELFDRIYAIYNKKNNLYEAKIRLEVLQMLINVVERHFSGYMPKKFIPDHIKTAVKYIKINYNKKLTLENILEEVGFSRAHFSREFKKYVGVSVIEYVNYVKCDRARTLMSKGSSVSEAAITCGFSNLSYFTRTYKKIMGNLPSTEANK